MFFVIANNYDLPLCTFKETLTEIAMIKDVYWMTVIK